MAIRRRPCYAEAFVEAMACRAVSIAAMWIAAPRQGRLVAGQVARRRQIAR